MALKEIDDSICKIEIDTFDTGEVDVTFYFYEDGIPDQVGFSAGEFEKGTGTREGLEAIESAIIAFHNRTA